MSERTELLIRAHYYQQFDADPTLEVPAEAYGGWKTAEISIAPEHTAVVVMHAWDFGKPDEFPGWRRCVEYIPRAEEVCRKVFPKLLQAVRKSSLKLFHVVSAGNYYKSHPGYAFTKNLAGPEPPPPEQIKPDPTLSELRRFRSEHVFLGKHNQEDVRRGFGRLDFAPEAKPLDNEPIAENGHQLFAVCKHLGVNHLIYTGFAVNWCLLLSPGGMHDMSSRGLMCSVIPEAVTAVENKETARQELCKQIALWRVALAFGFVFDLADFLTALRTESKR